MAWVVVKQVGIEIEVSAYNLPYREVLLRVMSTFTPAEITYYIEKSLGRQFRWTVADLNRPIDSFADEDIEYFLDTVYVISGDRGDDIHHHITYVDIIG